VKTVIPGVLACVLALAGIGIGSASAATSPYPNVPAPTMAHKLWLIKDDDLNTIDTTPGQAGPGDSASDYDWISCGLSTDPFNVTINEPCAPSEIRTYASYSWLQKDIADGKLPSGSTILFDPEFWVITPRWEVANPDKFLRKAARLCAQHHITIIEAPVGDAKDGGQLNQQVTAARYAPIVDLQDQYEAPDVAGYISTTKAAVAAMRKVNPNVTILAGIAPSSNDQVPITAAQMYQEYRGVYSSVQGYWLNADEWAGAPGCAPVGCPDVVNGFLSLVNAAG
jgi:hypothetical protein